jgi:hypothetical protein
MGVKLQPKREKSSLHIVYAETEAIIIQMLGGKTEVIGSEKSCFP